jgi:hypothetical protein
MVAGMSVWTASAFLGVIAAGLLLMGMAVWADSSKAAKYLLALGALLAAPLIGRLFLTALGVM